MYKKALHRNRGAIALLAAGEGKEKAPQHPKRWEVAGLWSSMCRCSWTGLRCRWLRGCWGPLEQLLAVSVVSLESTASGNKLHRRRVQLMGYLEMSFTSS